MDGGNLEAALVTGAPAQAAASPQAITLRQWPWLLDGLPREQPTAYRSLRPRQIV
ncbi:MAG: hypothetical protein OWU84_02395 [Firmicutes bacterium]|nr:hypothetical protein [Bacillota bacterium]